MTHCYLCGRLIWPWQSSARMGGVTRKCHRECLRLRAIQWRLRAHRTTEDATLANMLEAENFDG